MDQTDLGTLSNLSFQWMKIDGPHLDSCCIIHPQTTCATQVLNKMFKTMSITKQFYGFFHLLHFLLKLRKNIRQGKMTRQVFKTFKNFARSILFMAHLAGGLKLLKCSVVKYFNQMDVKIDGKILVWGLFVSSLGIFWQQRARRQQIAYFAFIRSVRSSYMFLKRRNIISFPKQKQVCLILLFGLMSYIFTSFPQTVKISNFLTSIWGNF